MKSFIFKNPELVYYGPYPCKDTQTLRRKGNKGCNVLIVKAGNQASAELEFDAVSPFGDIVYPNYRGEAKPWKLHKCKK